MKKIVCLLLCIIGIINLNAQNTNTVVNDPNAELRDVDEFKSIEVSSGFIVYISQGKTQAVAVSCSNEKNNEDIITTVENGVLKIYRPKSTFKLLHKNQKFRAYITVKNIEKLDISGACIVNLVNPIKADDLEIDISGASIIKGEVNAKHLNSDVRGASISTLKGNVASARINVSGASILKAFNLLVEEYDINVSGASIANIYVTQKLIASASGTSSIKYKSTTENIKVNSTGLSNISEYNKDN